MKIRLAAICLIVSSIIWIAQDLYSLIFVQFTQPMLDYYKGHYTQLVLSIAMILVPISLLLLGISLLNNNKSIITEQPSLNKEDEFVQNTNIPSVSDWLINYLIAAIPIIGLVYIIIWANDNDNKLRKNWAIAMLIWSGIIFVILIFVYAALLNSLKSRYLYY